MTIKFKILGCGSSAGVPRIGGDWGMCDPNNPKNRRRRCSLLVEKLGPGGTTHVLIDTSPDMRDQMLSADVRALDGVFYTHEHADHTHGIDELRAFYLIRKRRIEVWADELTGQMLLTRFGYCFYTAPGSDYPPIISLNRLLPGHTAAILGDGGAVEALPFKVHHGNIDALGFRIGKCAYTPDLNGIPDESLAALSGLDLWIVDALRHNPHPTHFSVDETLSWVDRLRPARAIITNMHVDLDYEALRRELPPHVEPAFDGLEIIM